MSDEKEQPWWHETAEDTLRYREGNGSATQEAVKLAAALSEWASKSGLAATLKGFAEETKGGVKMAADLAAQASRTATSKAAGSRNGFVDIEIEEAVPEPFLTCDSCPVCQGLAILREVSPEAAAGMAEALSAVTEVFKQTVETMSHQEKPKTRVEHIDIE